MRTYQDWHSSCHWRQAELDLGDRAGIALFIYTVRVRSRFTGALNISLFADPVRHQGRGLSDTRGVKHLKKYTFDIACVAGVKPALGRIADGIYLLQCEVDHIRPIVVGIVNFQRICCLTFVAGVPSLV